MSYLDFWKVSEQTTAEKKAKCSKWREFRKTTAALE